MGNEVWFVLGKNKVRLVTKRGIEVTEDVNDSVKVTLQSQNEEIIGKVLLSDLEGKELPLIETLITELGKVISAIEETAIIYTVIARETISSVSSSTGFSTANIPTMRPKTVYALVQAINGDVRYTIDGTTPTSTLGLRLLQDDNMEVWGSDALTNFRAIDDGGTAKLEVIYMGHK